MLLQVLLLWWWLLCMVLVAVSVAFIAAFS